MTAILTLSPTLPVKHQDFGYMSFDLTHSNEDSGASQAVVNGPVRRTCALMSEAAIPLASEAAAWRVLVQGMNGQVNRLAVYDMLNQVPRGSARGNWTAQALAAAGASSMTIALGADQAGKTLLAGDWFGVNQDSVQRQLLHVMVDAVANGAGLITVQFGFTLRVPVAAGSAIVWNRPTCLMSRTDPKNSWATESKAQGGFNMDLVERWG